MIVRIARTVDLRLNCDLKYVLELIMLNNQNFISFQD